MPEQPTNFPRNLNFSRLIRRITAATAATSSCHLFQDPRELLDFRYFGEAWFVASSSMLGFKWCTVDMIASDVRMSQVLVPESARANCGEHRKGKGERFV
jgi:hypothetical protein